MLVALPLLPLLFFLAVRARRLASRLLSARRPGEQLRVAFLHPDLGIGGAERLVVDAAVSLQRRGHSVVMHTAHHDASRCFEETRDGTLAVRVAGDWLPRTVLGRLHIVCATLRALYGALVLLATEPGCGDRARVWRGGGGPGLRARAAPPPRRPRRALLLPLSRQAALERGGCRRAALHGRRAEARGALAVPAAVRPARGGDDGLREHRARQLALHRLGLRRRLSAAAGAAARAGPGRARGAPPVHRHRRRRGAAGVARRRAAGAAGLDQPLRGQEEPAARRGGAARAHPGAGRQEGGQRPPHARGGLGPAAARERRVLRGAAGPRPPCLARNPFRPAP